MPPNRHALLSASSSDRWLHCPPSARLCETYEDKGSDYAAEGTDPGRAIRCGIRHAVCRPRSRERRQKGTEDRIPVKGLPG